MNNAMTVSSNYQESRNFADAFLAQQNQIATGLILQNNLMSVTFTPPTYKEDAINGIDGYIDITRLKVAYRVRKPNHIDYWRYGFTLRTSKKYGYPSELEKVMKGDASYADYMLYSVADEQPGQLLVSALIDLKSVGAQLVAYPEILTKEAKWSDYFVDLPYAAFPDPVIVGMY